MTELVLVTKETQPPSPRTSFPKPYKQGQLDTLCGIYAVMNACKNACYTANPDFKINGRTLFQACVDALQKHGKLSRALYNAQNTDEIIICLKAAKQTLSKLYRIKLSYCCPLKRQKHRCAKRAFSSLERHLQNPGSSAILYFTSDQIMHWTAIRKLAAGKLILSDSAWIKPMATSGFSIAPQIFSETRYSFEREALILLKVTGGRLQYVGAR